ncbi:MAG TPA: hypothetical protein VH482_31330 [Thermomicrobiales bacterium]|jgi:hypothetical protein
MATIMIYRMTAREFSPERVRAAAKLFGLRAEVADSPGGAVVHDERRVLAVGAPCGRQPGVLMYTNTGVGLGDLCESPLAPDDATKSAMALLSELDLLPKKRDDDRTRIELTPSASVTEAVLFDGRERRRVPARTDFRARVRINDLPVDGPRTRIRAAFHAEPEPISLYAATWEEIEPYEEVELVREHEVLGALEKSLRGRADCGSSIRVHNLKLAYVADDFRGTPDLLAPAYLIEIEGPAPRTDGRSARPETPRQLVRLPAWRTAL